MAGLTLMSLLQTQGLSRHFGGVQAVRAVNFELPPGHILTITPQGKSLRAYWRLQYPHASDGNAFDVALGKPVARLTILPRTSEPILIENYRQRRCINEWCTAHVSAVILHPVGRK